MVDAAWIINTANEHFLPCLSRHTSRRRGLPSIALAGDSTVSDAIVNGTHPHAPKILQYRHGLRRGLEFCTWDHPLMPLSPPRLGAGENDAQICRVGTVAS